jgi:polysaccharide biosynthesis/export protein
MGISRNSKALLGISLSAIVLSGCAGKTSGPALPTASVGQMQSSPSEGYVIGAFDLVQVFVWRNPELSAEVRVRPDGRITTPLITDMPAVGKTPTMLAQDIKLALSEYIRDPLVNVVVKDFAANSQQIRVMGAGEKPVSMPYRANMTLLDAMITAGGIGEFTKGNKSRLIRSDRSAPGGQRQYPIRLGDLLKRGDISANVKLQPGDVILIPNSGGFTVKK